MYPKRKAKSDRERFLEAFKKKVGCAPEVYVRRKLASGMNEEELSKLYDMLAIEIARRASCTAIRYADVLKTPEPKELCMQKAASFRVPVCEKCGANMVLRSRARGRVRSSGAAPIFRRAGLRKILKRRSYEKSQTDDFL